MSDCTCPRIDGYRIKKKTCLAHNATDTYPEESKVLAWYIARVRELEATLQAVEGEVAKVYCDLTGGRISKANTIASAVIGEAEAYNERTCVADAWDEGYEAGDEYGYSNACAARYGDSPDDPPPTNPYRTVVSDGSE